MKKLFVIFISILIFIPQAQAKTGKGELKLSKKIMTEFMMYLYGASSPKYSMKYKKTNHPMLMVVSQNGRNSYYYYCPYARGCDDIPNYVNKATKRCEKLSNGNPCYLFAKKRKIVWKNGVKSKKRRFKKELLKEPYKIAQQVQELGFYDGNISELPGIDPETAKILDNKEKEKSTDNVDIVKELKELNSLLESGVISAEEFEKAKKKLLN